MPGLVGSTIVVIEPSRMGARVVDGAKVGPSVQGSSLSIARENLFLIMLNRPSSDDL
jgi:hypothetical protein